MRRLIGIALAGLAVAALVAPQAATGADATATSGFGNAVLQTPGAKLSLVDVQIWPSSDPTVRSTLIVVGVIPTSTPLPTTVYLPVPADVPVQWIGEIAGSGGDQSGDIQRPVVIEDGTGGKVLKVEVQKHREVQYEADLSAPRESAGRRALTLTWVQSAPADKVQFSFKTPQAADDVKTVPKFKGKPDQNQLGERLYVCPPQVIETGKSQNLAVDYIPRVPGGEDLVLSTTSRDWLMPGLLGLLAVAVAAIAVLMVRQQQAGSPPPVEGDVGEDAPRRAAAGGGDDSFGEWDE